MKILLVLCLCTHFLGYYAFLLPCHRNCNVKAIMFLLPVMPIVMIYFGFPVPAKLVELYIDLRRSSEEHVRVCMCTSL